MRRVIQPPSPPSCATTRAFSVAELPPNGQGVIALVILGILEKFDLENLDPLGPERFHLEMEASRIAYAVRDKFVTDPNYMDVCHTRLIGSDYIDQLASLVSRESAGFHASRSVAFAADRHGLSERCRQGRTFGFLHQFPVQRFRLGDRRTGKRCAASQPRQVVQGCARATPIRSMAASGRCTRSYPPWCSRTARPSFLSA